MRRRTPVAPDARPARRLAAGAAAAIGLAFAWIVLVPAGPAAPVLVDIEPHEHVRAIADRLKEAGLIRSTLVFRVLARVGRRPLKAGEYGFARVSMLGILRAMAAGKVYLHRVLVREGDALVQVADAVALEGVADADRFRAAARDRALLRKLGVPAAARSAEGYLFPDSYLIPKGMSPADMVGMMVRRFREKLPPDYRDRVAGRKLGLHQLVILASIVEKEARVADERPVIAGVFTNRLKRPMPLQADPTVLYGLGRWDAHLRLADLKTDTPYNTYLHAGLPPGPICNPGLASLLAAAAPAPTPALYFVTRKDGTMRHVFSRTLAEHERAVRESRARAKGTSKPPGDG